MAEPRSAHYADLVNRIAFELTVGQVKLAQAMADHGEQPSTAAYIAIDAMLVSAVSFVNTAVMNEAITLTQPLAELLHQRLDELLAMPSQFHPRLPDGSFDPFGQARN